MPSLSAPVSPVKSQVIPERPKQPAIQFPGAPRGTDTVPAWLTPKEYVVNEKSAQANRSLLEAINRAHGKLSQFSAFKFPPQRFESGGNVEYLAKGGPARKPQGAAGWLEAFNKPKKLTKYGERLRATAEKRRQAGKDYRGMEAQGRMYEAGGQAIGGLFSNKELEGIGGASEAVGTAGGAIPVIGPVIESVGKFGKQLTDSLNKLKTWSDQLSDANLKFKEFSAAMAGVGARQEIRDIEYSQARGEARARSAEALAEGRQSYRQNVTGKLGDTEKIIQNALAAAVLKGIGDAAEKYGFSGSIDKLNKWLEELLLGKDLPDWSYEKELEDAHKKAEDARRPPRLR
jgi:hypothetical protein